MKIEKTALSRWDNEAWKNAGFGSVFSDHMFIVNYKDGQWQMSKVGEAVLKNHAPTNSAECKL